MAISSASSVSASTRPSSSPLTSEFTPSLPRQHQIFESAADGTSFEVYEDPKGNWLGERGTEIVMILKEGEKEWLQADTLKELV
jgi:heat shock protein beta